ncbi:MAG: HEPN domain-containing protein [Chloroflexota bacterium]
MQDPSTGLVIDRGERYLNTARLALENGDPESAASRAYYALYHVTILLLKIVKGIERDRWGHPQLQQAFLDEFCKLGFKFNRNDGDDWAEVMQARLKADYWRDQLTHRSAREAVAKAHRLVDKMRTEIRG